MDGKIITELLDELRRIHRQLGELNYRIDRFKRVVAASQSSVVKATANLKAQNELKQTVLLKARSQEKEAADALRELERRRAQLDMAKSNREYEQIKLQIELEERKSDATADAALEALANVDAEDAKLKERNDELTAAKEKLAKAQEDLSTNEPKLRKEIENATARLRNAESRLPREFAGQYERAVTNFGGDALAPLSDGGFCGSCDRQIPTETIMKVCTGTAVLCTSCGRLLYAPAGFKFQ